MPNRAKQSGDANSDLAHRPALDGADFVDYIQEEPGVCLDISIRTEKSSNETCNNINKSSYRSCNILRRKWSSEVDLVTITVVSVVLVSYVIGALASTVETERQLPHRY